MTVTKHNPSELFPQYPNYSHAVEVSSKTRTLFISGLNGYLPDGETMPESFEAQGEIIWGHIGTILKSAGMDYENIVYVRTYLTSPDYRKINAKLRKKYLGDHEPASTIVCSQLLLPEWKLEVEAIAAL
jgi:enamine deaminase RidA (YjgF/YER057c/UK114 family)